MSTASPRFQLVSVEHSYYSGKARGYLRWRGVPFTEVGASIAVYKEFILPKTSVAYIPVLVDLEKKVIHA